MKHIPALPFLTPKTKFINLLILLLILQNALLAQIVNVLPNNNATSGNGRAPQGSRLYINTIYILTPSEMETAAFGSNNITSVGWTWNNPDGAGTPSAQSVNTSGTLSVYIQNTTDLAYAKGTIFSTAGMTKVFDGNIELPATSDKIDIDILLGGPGTSPFFTIDGQGIYIAFEYFTATTIALPIGSPTVSCNNTLANSLATYQSQVANGTSMTVSAFRPETRLGKTTPATYPSEPVALCKPNTQLITTDECFDCTYQWYRNGIPIPGAINFAYTVIKTGNYNVRVDYPDGSYGYSNPVSIAINQIPEVNINAPNGTSLCTIVKLRVTKNPLYSHQWFLNGIEIPGATSFQIVATTAGEYYCISTIVPTGCNATSSTMTVTDCRVESASELNEIAVFPNPNNGEFNIFLPEINGAEYNLNIINALGEIVHHTTGKNDQGELFIQFNEAAAGIYFIEIKFGNSIRYSRYIRQ
ncbi:MAG: T9SS type A sorting domain-containing protein [Chitinophagales bacterium]